MNENQQEKLVLVDGEIMPEAEAFIDVNDRGHNFGDGVFEIVPVYNGRCFALLPHMNNLFDSVIAVKIPGVYMIEELVEFHESLLAATGLKDCEIYTQVTRGSGAYALSYPEQSIPHLTMYAVPVDREALAEKRAKGVNVITVEDVRWARCDINTLNRLPEVMAPYVARMDFIIGVQAKAPHNCGVVSWNGTMYINMIRNIREPELESHFYRVLHALGLPVKVESNQRWA